MRFRIVALSLAVLSLFGNAAIALDASTGVIERYTNSIDLPDSIAFGSFLDMLVARYDEPESAFIYAARALGLDMDTIEGRSRAMEFTDQLRDWSIRLELQYAQEAFAVLCSENLSTRPLEDVGNALNRTDEIRTQVQEEYLQLALEALDDKERVAFLNFLEKTKTGVSYTRIDSAFYYESHPDRSIWEDSAKACNELTKIIEVGEEL